MRIGRVTAQKIATVGSGSNKTIITISTPTKVILEVGSIIVALVKESAIRNTTKKRNLLKRGTRKMDKVTNISITSINITPKTVSVSIKSTTKKSMAKKLILKASTIITINREKVAHIHKLRMVS